MPHERAVTKWVDEHINKHRDDKLIYKFQSKRHKEVFSALTKDYRQKLGKLTLLGRGIEAYIEHHLYEFRMDIYLNDRRLRNHCRALRLIADKVLRINKEVLRTNEKKVNLKRLDRILFALHVSTKIKVPEAIESIQDAYRLNSAYDLQLGDLIELYIQNSKNPKYGLKFQELSNNASRSTSNAERLPKYQLVTHFWVAS